MCIGGAVAHFLNCLVGACPNPAVSAGEAPAAAGVRGARGGRGRRTRRHHHQPQPQPPNTDWQNLTPKSLFSQIKNELKVSECCWINETVIESNQKYLMLRVPTFWFRHIVSHFEWYTKWRLESYNKYFMNWQYFHSKLYVFYTRAYKIRMV